MRFDGSGYEAARILLRKTLGRWEPPRDPGWVGRNWLRLALMVPLFGAVFMMFFKQEFSLSSIMLLAGAAAFPMFASKWEMPGWKYVPQYPNQTRFISFQVRLVAEVDGRQVGEDCGVVWFSEDRLHYEGFRSSFSLERDHYTVMGSHFKIGEDTLTLASDTALGLAAERGSKFSEVVSEWGAGRPVEVFQGAT